MDNNEQLRQRIVSQYAAATRQYKRIDGELLRSKLDLQLIRKSEKSIDKAYRLARRWEGQLARRMTPKAKEPRGPDCHVLRMLLDEYLEMLHDAERGVRKTLRLDSNKEEFWGQLPELGPTITLIESRSSTIQEEIDELMDQRFAAQRASNPFARLGRLRSPLLQGGGPQ